MYNIYDTTNILYIICDKLEIPIDENTKINKCNTLLIKVVEIALKANEKKLTSFCSDLL